MGLVTGYHSNQDITMANVGITEVAEGMKEERLYIFKNKINWFW